VAALEAAVEPGRFGELPDGELLVKGVTACYAQGEQRERSVQYVATDPGFSGRRQEPPGSAGVTAS
jgi:hypothetical protein